MENRKKYLLLIVLMLSSSLVRAQEFSLTTNLISYVNFGTVNMEAAYGVSQHWSVNAGMRYNPFTFSIEEDGTNRSMRNRQQCYSLGVRYWPWHIFSGWWFAGKLQYQEYNAGAFSPMELNTTEGDRIGGGLTGGYTFMLSPHFNMELGVGLWAGTDDYVTYDCPECGRVVDKGQRFFMMLNDILLSFSYVF